MPPSIPENLEKVRFRMSQFAQAYDRAAGTVELIAVSKTHRPDKVREAYAAGQKHFGENYLQEALDKQSALLDTDIIWHFIGPIQSNKTRDIAEHFAWVHSVDREKIARRLSEQRPNSLPPLQVLLQVNISGEDSKSGVAVNDLPALAAFVSGLPNLLLAGLMSIPAQATGLENQRVPFRQLREARDHLISLGHKTCQHLSIGMSGDFEAAIAEGATLIRIGTDIFGPRENR